MTHDTLNLCIEVLSNLRRSSSPGVLSLALGRQHGLLDVDLSAFASALLLLWCPDATYGDRSMSQR